MDERAQDLDDQGRLAVIGSVALVGIEPRPIRVESSAILGLPGVRLVGLPDTAIRESVERIRSAIKRSGLAMWDQRLVVSLAPAELPKMGAGFDLPTALAVLASSGVVPPEALKGVYAHGELGLDGATRPVPGAIAVAEGARRAGASRLLVPDRSAVEASLVSGPEVVPVARLSEAVAILQGTQRARIPANPPPLAATIVEDLADVRGQHTARRALEVAAAGGHHLLFAGPPGCGKSMLARRLPGLLPELNLPQALEVATIHSVAGVRDPETTLSLRPPFRAPHHSISPAGLVGGGSGVARPGELSLAHRGVLFIDELLEVPRHVLDGLRQPLEHGEVTVVRTRATVRLPARVQLVAATNPCPCGHLGDPRRPCRCRPDQIARYRARLSGPLLDRIDLQVELAPVEAERLLDPADGEPTSVVAARVAEARALAEARAGGPIQNRDLPIRKVRASCDPAAVERLGRAVDGLGLSARAFDRSLRVARTIADLDGAAQVTTDHVDEALAYRLAEPAHVG